MYSYNNVPTYSTNIPMYRTETYGDPNMINGNANDDRFIGPFLGPLLLGGIAGYALRPPYPAPYPVPAPYPAPYPVPGPMPYVPYNEPTQVYSSNTYYY